VLRVIALTYCVVAMAYMVVFVFMHMNANWSLDTAVQHALLWPVQALRELI
jgi:hypothetical protein